MPFNAENVDKLYSETYDENPDFKPSSRSNQRVILLIKDHQNGGIVKEVFWSSVEDSLRVFKEKDFNHLWNSVISPSSDKRTIGNG